MPSTRGPPWVPMTAPMRPVRTSVAGEARRRSGRGTRRRRAPRRRTPRGARRPAPRTAGRAAPASAFLRVRCLPASSTWPPLMLISGLIDQQRAEQGLGAADAAALLEVVERVERGVDAGAGHQVVDQRHDLVDASCRLRPASAASSTMVPSAGGERAAVDDPHVDLALERPGRVAGRLDGGRQLAGEVDADDARRRPRRPACGTTCSKAPGAGAAVSGSASDSAMRR